MEAPVKRAVAVSTWIFGYECATAAGETLMAGGETAGLDAIVDGISVVEMDEEVESVGYGGMPNERGVVQLDACIMSGPVHEVGCVMALEGFVPSIPIARAVLENSRHCIYAGEGARQFALSQGFKETNTLSPTAKAKWEEHKKLSIHERPFMRLKHTTTAQQQQQQQQSDKPKATNNAAIGHDTVGLLVLTREGDLYGGCATSGLSFKDVGRVGDSPIIGSGLYVDNEIGAATATGVGEALLKECISFATVEYMRQGYTPQEACDMAVTRTMSRPQNAGLAVAVLAIDKLGRVGGRGTEADRFCYAVWFEGMMEAEMCFPPSWEEYMQVKKSLEAKKNEHMKRNDP